MYLRRLMTALLLTASSWPGMAANPDDVQRLSTTGHCRECNLAGADLRGRDLSGAQLAGADLRQADLRHLDADLDLEFVDLRGVRLEGARFAHGVTCGARPGKGGFGCSAVLAD